MKKKRLFHIAVSVLLAATLTQSACKKKSDPQDPSTPPVGNSIPTLTTSTISGLTDTSVVSGGSISSNGDGVITSAGICWDTISNPSVSGNKTNNYQNNSLFTAQLTGLLPGHTYFIRAYATNSHGTAYGNEISFTTSKSAKWIPWTNGLGEKTVTEIIIVGNDLFAATTLGVYKSSGGQNNWTPAGLTNIPVSAIISSNGVLFAGTQNGVYVSSNGGNSWAAANTGFYLTSSPILDLASSGTKVYANTIGSGWEEIYMSANNGQQWNWITNINVKAYGLEVIGSTVYFFDAYHNNIRSSTDDGVTWNIFSTLPTSYISDLYKLISVNNTLYACIQKGLYSVQASGPTPVYTSTMGKSCLNAEIHNSNMYISFVNDVKFSTNNGSSWTSITYGLKGSTGNVGSVYCLRSFQGTLFAGTASSGIFKLIE